MSRIHEALKKAEQERSQVSSTVAPPSIEDLPPIPVAVASAPVPRTAVTRVSEATLDVAEETSVWSHSSLVERCAKPDWTPQPSATLFLNTESNHEPGMEEFRTLRSRLYRLREHRPLKTILVGSALPAEGKSFVSGNLAQVLSRQQGRRALLIDGDLRAPRLHKYLGTPSSPGLTDYLRGDANEFDVIQRSPSENLFFIPGGSSASTPAELVANGRFRTLVDRMSGIFDWIIIDSSPILPVSDAGLLSQYCDGVLLVVLAGKTASQTAQRAVKEFKDRPMLGVVLNRIKQGSQHGSYYYYGRYGYGYGAPAKTATNGKQ
jgi:protein-tyrosine kinase